MAVTELALLRLKSLSKAEQLSTSPNQNDTTSSSTTISPLPNSVLNELKTAAEAQAKYSEFPVTILRCIEDPTLLYLIGGWFSPSQHLHEWIPSQQNQELMTRLSEYMDVLWMFHIDADPVAAFKLLSRSDKHPGVPSADCIVAIVRHFVRNSAREDFWRKWSNNADALQTFLGDGNESLGSERIAKGWAIDYGAFVMQDPGREAVRSDSEPDSDVRIEELVLFTTWPSVDKHHQFAKSSDIERYSQSQNFMVGAEIKHAKVLLEAQVAPS